MVTLVFACGFFWACTALMFAQWKGGSLYGRATDADFGLRVGRSERSMKYAGAGAASAPWLGLAFALFATSITIQETQNHGTALLVSRIFLGLGAVSLIAAGTIYLFMWPKRLVPPAVSGARGVLMKNDNPRH